MMLTLTPIASEAIRQLSAQTEDPEAAGIRIAPVEGGSEFPEGTALELSLVVEPEPADEKVDDDGATVYLEPHVAGFLDDKVLDAQVEEGSVTFLVRDDDALSPDDFTTQNGGGA
jgi:iron-sulfur cluster assembly protein